MCLCMNIFDFVFVFLLFVFVMVFRNFVSLNEIEFFVGVNILKEVI